MKHFFNPDNKGKAPAFKNPFAPANRPKKSFGGSGQSLGGTKPGKVLEVSLANPGPLGVKVEKRNHNNTAIIAMVVPNTQAEAAGLLRGDVVCVAGTQGQEEITYQQFLKAAASSQRPMVFDVRRIETNKNSDNTVKSNTSAEAEARKRAVIAAAEKRDAQHKQKSKPMAKVPKKETVMETPVSELSEEPKSLEAKQAIAAAKNQEEILSAQLGYNPYETNKASAGQARNATVAMTHGTIQGGSGDGNNNTASGGLAPPPALAPPPQATVEEASENKQPASQAILPPVSDAFEDAFTTVVTTNDHDRVLSSLATLRKLMVNATTKGQASEDDSKFRRVRLGNAKIQAVITDIHGALELMLAVGFQLLEEDGETFLVYPFPSKGPEWLTRALDTMQQYETSNH